MSPNLELLLHNKYPELLGEQEDGEYRPRVWGFEHHDGWNVIVDTLCQSIQHRIKHAPGLVLKVTQVKEKFGELRFYYSGGDDYIEGAVLFAELFSSRICEQCGQLGQKMKIKGWVITRCPLHTPE